MIDLTKITHRDTFSSLLPRGGVGVEVGVFRGEFSQKILDWWDGVLIGVDRYNGGEEFEIMMDAIRRNMAEIDAGRYKIIVCDSTSGPSKCPSNLEFVYIDADHSYRQVMNDIRAWYPKIKTGGVLCGHDYGLETGVKKAIDQFLKGDVVISPCGSWFHIKK
jgi:hypothetical protein